MANHFYLAFAEQMNRLQSGVESIDAELADTTEGQNLPIDALTPGRYQPRRSFQDAELQELADSIRQQGLIQPVVVRPIGDGAYELLAGERRWRACKLIGQDSIRAIVRDVDDQAAIAMSLIENIQRENLSPIEEAEGYQRLMNEFGLRQSQVGELVGKSRSRISRLLSLINLPEPVKEMIGEESISGAHGIVLAASGLGESECIRFAKSAIKRQWSRDQLEQAINAAKASPKTSDGSPARTQPPEWFTRLQKEVEGLNRTFGQQVSVQLDRQSQAGVFQIPFDIDVLHDFEDTSRRIINALRRAKQY